MAHPPVGQTRAVHPTWPLTARATLLEQLGRAYADRDVGGVVLVGPAGVGKTRLADEVLRLAAEAGRPTARVIGHPATAPIPLGALAHLLPADLGLEHGDPDDGRGASFHRARAALAELAGDDRLVLHVDDVDQLDGTSLALLLPLTIDRVVFPLATLRAGRPLPGPIATLLKDGHLVRVEPPPLTADEVATLLHRVLDGPVDAEARQRLADASAGNLQVLRELVRAALDAGALRRDGPSWRLDELPVSGALEDLVTSQVAALPEAARGVLELLAVGGRLGLPDLEALAPLDALEALDAEGLLRVGVEGRRTVVAVAHPLYGEVLRASISRLRERALQRRLADRLEAVGARRRDDTLRLARWRLEAGGDVDASVLVRAGRIALVGRDVGLAERFAAAAAERGSATEAARLRVEAAWIDARPRALEAAVLEVWDDPRLDDHQRAHLARRLADSRFATRDLPGALDSLRRATAACRDPAVVASLEAHRAALLANAGKPLEALAAIETVTDLDDPSVRVELETARGVALLSVGRFDEAGDAVAAATAAQEQLPAWLARRGSAGHLVNAVHVLAYAGRLTEARELLGDASQRALADRALGAHVWFELVLGEIERDRGRGPSAVTHFRRAAELAERAGQAAVLQWAHVGIAEGSLLVGDTDAAAAALDVADAEEDSPLATSLAVRRRCRAWLLAARGDLVAARRLLDETADVVRADGLVTFEGALRYDVVRFGGAEAAVDRLVELAEAVEGPLVGARAAHARGSATGDAATLAEAVERFEALDAACWAAEAAAELADVLRRDGDARGATAAARRAATWAERGGGLRTPALRRGAPVEPLTAREREVALLAAGGLPSREIAERLYLSKRTVDTHLDRVYRKLGISGRAELPAALDGAPPPAGDT